MTDRDVFDEDGRSLSSASRVLGRLLRERAARWDSWLDETTTRVARDHNIDDHDPLRALLRELSRLPTEHPTILSVEPGEVRVQSDLTTWKEAREQLEELRKALAKADQLIAKAFEDPVWCAAIARADEMTRTDDVERLPGLLSGISELLEVVRAAAEIKGTSGNRPNPDWHARAAEMCRAFWSEHKGEKPKPYFNKASRPRSDESAGSATTEPGNKFSIWFCDVMRTVAGMTPTACDTALRKRQPQKTTEY